MYLFRIALFAFLAAIILRGFASADQGSSVLSKNLSLVYDQQSNQYFIGGSSKLLLKQDNTSGPIDKIEVSVDGGEFSAYSDGLQFKEEGKHSLKFRALNPVNNWSPVQFIQVFVDLTAPTSTAKFSEEKYYKEGDNLFLGMNSTVSLTSQDNLSGIGLIEWAWVNHGESEDQISFTPYVKPIVIDQAGPRTLVYRAMDRVGNVEASKKVSFIADGTAPVSTLKIQGAGKSVLLKGQSYLSDGAAFAIEANDDASKVKQIWVEIDGKPQVYIKPIYFLKEGLHKLTYYALDNCGNKEQSKTYSLYTVSTPPKTVVKTVGPITNVGGINFSTKAFQMSLSAQDNIVGLEKIEVKVDKESDFKTYVEPIRFIDFGMHQVTYRSVDRVGNAEPAKTFTLNIHETPPETTYATAQPLMNKDGVLYSSAPNVITFNAGSSPVGFKETQISINDSEFKKYTGPITLTAEHKVYKIAYRSLDQLGNEEKAKLLTINMISNVPIVDLFISNGNNKEEQVRTRFLDNGVTDTKDRQPASNKKR
ncbi:MAG: hypothetical protein AB7F43_06625 [Bacteriovoracia bacterium]